jgi:hypothetical protein
MYTYRISIKEESQFESDRKEREATEKLAIEEDTAKEIFLWIAEAAISLASLFLITAVLLSFFGILEFSIN